MHTQTTAQQTPTTSADYDPQRPYRDYSALQLWESLEVQHNSGEYNPPLLWELALRACELEALNQR